MNDLDPNTPTSYGIKNCFSPCLLVSALVIAVYSFLFDWLTQGKLFASYYAGTEQIFRPMETMPSFLPLCLIVHAAIAYLVTKGFFKWRRHIMVGAVDNCHCPYRKGMGYGIWMGMILGLSWASAYIMLPIPGKLAVMWLLTTLVKWTLAGGLLSKLYDWKVKNSV